MTKYDLKVALSALVAFIFTLNPIPNVLGAESRMSSVKENSVQPTISNIKLSKRGKIYPGDKMVATLIGENLDQVLSANMMQKMRSVGHIDIEKYTATNGKQRRIILNLNQQVDHGPFTLQLISKNKLLVKLPAHFRPFISKRKTLTN